MKIFFRRPREKNERRCICVSVYKFLMGEKKKQDYINDKIKLPKKEEEEEED